MKIKELLETIDQLLAYEGLTPESEIFIGHYEDGLLIEDLEIEDADWIFASADDDHLSDFERKKTLELHARRF